MFCPRCGTEYREEKAICAVCGRNLSNLRPKTLPVKTETATATATAAAVVKTTTPTPVKKKPQLSDYPMKWYYFLIYCFFINMIISHFLTTTTNFIAIFSSFSTSAILLKVISCGFQLCLAIAAIQTRSALRGLKKNAPSLVTRYFVTNIAAQLFDLIVMLASDDISVAFMREITGGAMTAATIVSLVEMVILACACGTYFVNRRALFTNS